MTLLYSNVSILAHISTNGLVELPKFEDIDETFSCKYFMELQNSVQERSMCKQT